MREFVTIFLIFSKQNRTFLFEIMRINTFVIQGFFDTLYCLRVSGLSGKNLLVNLLRISIR